MLNKPAQIRSRLLQIGTAVPSDFERPPRLQETELSAIHTAKVLAGLRCARAIAQAGELSPLKYVPKVASDLDVGLHGAVQDAEYLEAVPWRKLQKVAKNYA